jgi:hypothetical protein
LATSGAWSSGFSGSSRASWTIRTRRSSPLALHHADLYGAEREGVRGRGQVVRLSYSVDSVKQWIVVTPLGPSEKGLPASPKRLRKWIEAQLAEAGVAVPARERRSFRECALIVARTLAVALITAAAAGLIVLLTRVADLKEFQWFACGIAIPVVGSAASFMLFRKNRITKPVRPEVERGKEPTGSAV